ncbi:hypothetical protein CRG98_029989 [Punica granatum]|uniref:Uncharacterized protein n=1 Tax=Punica granatum TaxID=22663 RepID=A0A2I0J024_PUNGR|nr:hypothetical protein CRG98_029989 [Punica granatum]
MEKGKKQRRNEWDWDQGVLPPWSSRPPQELLLAATRLPGELRVEGHEGDGKIRVFGEKDGRDDRGSIKPTRWAAAWRWTGPEPIRWASGPSGPIRAVKPGPKSD